VRPSRGLLAALLAVGVCLPSSSLGAPSLRFHANLTPKHPGQRTTAEFGIQIAVPGGGVPPPLTEARVRYPAGLGLSLSGLGIEACTGATLEAGGPLACPTDSFMGEGRASTEIQFGPEVVSEGARVWLLRTTAAPEGRLAMLFLVDGEEPVYAQPVLMGQLLPAAAPFGGRIDIAVPLVSSLPGAPYVSLVRLKLVIGPRGLVYRERIGGKIVSYRPKGLSLPERCPRGGYPFAVELQFLDGSRAASSTSVLCPAHGST
jgi:hypothetical protein